MRGVPADIRNYMWLGFHFVKMIQADPIRTVDMLTGSGEKPWLMKCPARRHNGFPQEYIQATTKWDNYIVICCKRNVYEVWRSSLKLWPSLEKTIGLESFVKMWSTYYRECERRRYKIVSHSEVKKNPQNYVNELLDWLGWEPVEVSKFIANTK